MPTEKEIPRETCSPFGSYPNLLEITEEERQGFHPVVEYPSNSTPRVNDYESAVGLASADEILEAKRRNTWWNRLFRSLTRAFHGIIGLENDADDIFGNISSQWNIGKYDENRLEMYSSEIFAEDNTVDTYSGKRTVHLGVDLGAPVGTKVYAFAGGKVHSLGYNADHGDYGYVVVIEHQLPAPERTVWALYGHLDESAIQGKRAGSKIKKGQVIGRIGDCHENGGWLAPHCHFQLSMRPPETHDMPGASSMKDRQRALNDYPDPRYVLGNVH